MVVGLRNTWINPSESSMAAPGQDLLETCQQELSAAAAHGQRSLATVMVVVMPTMSSPAPGPEWETEVADFW